MKKSAQENEITNLRESILKAQEEDADTWGAHRDPSGIPRSGFDEYVDFLQETLRKKI